MEDICVHKILAPLRFSDLALAFLSGVTHILDEEASRVYVRIRQLRIDSLVYL